VFGPKDLCSFLTDYFKSICLGTFMSKWSAWRGFCLISLIIASLGLSALLVPALLIRVCANVNYISFLKVLKKKQVGSVRVGFGYDARSETKISTSFFRKALSIDALDFGARRGLGRVLLFQNQVEEAAVTLRPLISTHARHPLLFLDVLNTFSLAGWDKEIYALETCKGWQYVPEYVLSRLDWGEGLLPISTAYQKWYHRMPAQKGESSVALGRAAPLSHQMACMKWMQAKGDREGLQIAIDALRKVDLYALVVPPGFLAISDAAVIPGLIQSEIWSLSLAHKVVSWLVWRYYFEDGLGDILVSLAQSDIQSSHWLFYYGEYQHRRGNFTQADVLYRRALELAQDSSHILLRLGLVHDALSSLESGQVAALYKARNWYERYLQHQPGDLLAGKLLLRVYQALGDPRSENLAKNLVSNTNLAASVSRLLGTDQSQVRLGVNLVPTGKFDQWQYSRRWLVDKPKEWQISNMAYEGSQFNSGSFVCGPDSIYTWQNAAAHIKGIWLEDDDAKVAGRFGFWLTENRGPWLDSRSPYVISFYYRTIKQAEGPTLWLSPDTSVLVHSVTGSDDYRLPATNGQWWRFVAVAWNKRAQAVRVNPLLRSWAAGEVWLDDFRISKILVQDDILPDQTVRIGIETLEMKN
jgi:tetratricopeptide (TPR) repeat protein